MDNGQWTIREYSQYLQNLGERITFLTQTEPAGYGHAVYCAKEWVVV